MSMFSLYLTFVHALKHSFKSAPGTDEVCIWQWLLEDAELNSNMT